MPAGARNQSEQAEIPASDQPYSGCEDDLIWRWPCASDSRIAPISPEPVGPNVKLR